MESGVLNQNKLQKMIQKLEAKVLEIKVSLQVIPIVQQQLKDLHLNKVDSMLLDQQFKELGQVYIKREEMNELDEYLKNEKNNM